MRLKTKLALLLTTLLLFPTFTFAQQLGGVSFKVLDAEISSLPVAGAIVEVTSKTDETNKSYYSTDGTGSLSVTRLAYGEYTLSVSFLGYEPVILPFKIDSASKTLPDIMMKGSTVQMETVVKEIKALRSSQKGDTLNYNAASFKVAADADVEGLLQKMPGIAIEDGEVTAQGEQIKKIYVDGREFFGNDVATALKSLPAEVVERIEVYDKLSDSAEMSGMDDGEGEKTINIVTHKSMRKGVFGKVFAGGGYEPSPYNDDIDKFKYMGGGSANLFYDTSRISVIALSNNLNQQNFSFEDIMGVTDDGSSGTNNSSFMVKPLPGVAVVNAVGVNYSDVFGEKDKLKVQASYFFNKTKTTNEETIKRWYEESQIEGITIIDSLEQQVYKVTNNSNHRLNGRIDWKISEKSNIMIRPTLSLQTSDPDYITQGMRYDSDSESSSYYREDADGNNLYGQQYFTNNGRSEWAGFNLGTNANYRLKLGKNNRNLTAGAGFSMNRYNYEGVYNNEISNWTGTGTDYDDDGNIVHNYGSYAGSYTFTDNPTNRLNLNANLGYTEPLADHWTLNLSYRISRNYQETIKDVYETTDDYSTSGLEPDEDSSSKVESTYITHRAGPGIRYGKGKTNLVANVYYQSSEMQNETTKYGTMTPVDKRFENITYSLVGQAYFNPQNSLRININSYTSNPSVNRMVEAVSNPSSDYISIGNSDLNPTYNTRVRLRYTHSNLEKGSTIMAMLSATHSNDYIASHIVTQPNDFSVGDLELSDLDQYTTWVNLDNYWSFYSRVNFGFPLDKIKCNLNFNVGASYTIIPNIIGGTVQNGGKITDGVEGNTDKIAYRGGATLGSNISKDIDFTISWWGEYNEATNVTTNSETVNKYYTQVASANLKYVFLGGFTFTGNAMYKQYKGVSDHYNVQYVLCNAFLGHKIFKNKRGEINVGVNDMLDQNTSFWRSIGSNYAQNTQNMTIGRYYSAQFIYSLRYFGKQGSTNIKDYKGMEKYLGTDNKKKRP